MIPIARIYISFVEEINGPPASHLLRGSIASHFPDEPLLHQHKGSELLYRYPFIQYRWSSKKGVLIGFHEGGKLLANLPLLGKEIMLGKVKTHISEVEISFSMEEISFSERLLRYHFVSPWLPLNRQNYEAYMGMSKAEQALERDRLAVANLLMALRGLKIEAKERVYASFQLRRVVSCRYKEQNLVGFLGTLLTNLDLPDDIAIGKAVSHGFGWLKRSNMIGVGVRNSKAAHHQFKIKEPLPYK